MMDWLTGLFDSLTRALDMNPWAAVSAAFTWGLLSILLSPCHLSGIPLAIGYINKKGKIRASRAFILSLLFSLGVLVTIAAIGVITGFLGRMLGDIGKTGMIIVAVFFILVGFWLMDIIPLPGLSKVNPDMKGRGGFGAFLLGLMFGSALGPCSFGFMMPLLLVVFRVAPRNLPYAAALLAAFAFGHILMIVLAGTFVNQVQNYLNWTDRSKGAVVFRRICALLVIITGISLLIGELMK